MAVMGREQPRLAASPWRLVMLLLVVGVFVTTAPIWWKLHAGTAGATKVYKIAGYAPTAGLPATTSSGAATRHGSSGSSDTTNLSTATTAVSSPTGTPAATTASFYSNQTASAVDFELKKSAPLAKAEGTASRAADDGAAEETEAELNALWITGPFFAVLAITAITFVRKAQAGTGSMPFGLPNMTADQLSVFGLCYMSYVSYHALRAGFSGCKSSMMSESGFTRSQMGNMDTGFLLAYAAGQFYWGSLADQVSAKVTTIRGMYGIAAVVIFFTLAELLGLSPNVTLGAAFFVLVRVVEGFLHATGWSGTVAMTSDWFGAAHRGAVMGVLSTDSNVGNIIGEIIVGSIFAVNGGWQTCLLILASLLAGMAWINSRRLVYPPPAGFVLPADQQQGVVDMPPPPPPPPAAEETDTESGDSAVGGCDEPAESIGILEAAMIPGVIPFALSYCFLKLVGYTLLFWLPFYLFEGAGLPKSLAALMATLNDVGMVVGAITAGYLTDQLTHMAKRPLRTPLVVGGLLAAIVPIGLLKVTTSPLLIGVWITIAGFFLGMPAECSTSAVCIDLAKSQPKAATATVIGIIDGTGAFGAAVGQQVVVYVSDPAVGGWQAVFNVLLASLLLSAAMVVPMAIREWHYLQELRQAGQNQIASPEATAAPRGKPDDASTSSSTAKTTTTTTSTTRLKSTSATTTMAMLCLFCFPLLAAPACVPPLDNFTFCNSSLTPMARAEALAALMTTEELISQMVDTMPAVPRLGITNHYQFGIEALHGIAEDCPWPGPGGRCFTSFAVSSAMAASFNRTLWYHFGRAQGDEARWAYDHGMLAGLHLRGPQLNPQRDPRWGRCDNSPGEDAYLQAEYGVQVVLGGQGALQNGTYPFGDCCRKALHEHKHFAAYSIEDGRNEQGDTWNIGLQDLADYYFPPLRALVSRADVAAVMCSYSAINGTASCADTWMFNEVLRGHWNWSDGGVVESDCGAVEGISSHRHGGWARATVETASAALNASVSVDCNDPGHNAYTKRLGEALGAGLVTRSQLELAVARVYHGRMQIGEFEPNRTAYRGLPNDTISSAAHQQLSLESAEQSIVLLSAGRRQANGQGGDKGEGSGHGGTAPLLPLQAGLKIAVIGPNGNNSGVFAGSYHGQICPVPDDGPGTDPNSKIKAVGCIPTVFDAINQRNGVGRNGVGLAAGRRGAKGGTTGGATTFVSGCSIDSNQGAEPRDHTSGPQTCSSLVDLDRVNATVAAADVVVLALGLANFVTNSEGMDRPHTAAGYALPGRQLELAKLVADLKKPTVVVLLSGMAVGIDFIAEQAAWALLVPGYGGPHGATAIARALFGDMSPSGKLPYTIYPEGWAAATPMTDMSLTAGQGRTYQWYGFKDPSLRATFEFGAGLSYSQFSVQVMNGGSGNDDIEGGNSGVSGGDSIIGSFDIRITNMGRVAASDALLVYVVPPSEMEEEAQKRINGSERGPTTSPSPSPRRRLVNFVRTPTLAPGASFDETFPIYLKDVAITDFAGTATAFGGRYGVFFSNGAGAEVTRTVAVRADLVVDQLPGPPALALHVAKPDPALLVSEQKK